jgi:hypothetical protein
MNVKFDSVVLLFFVFNLHNVHDFLDNACDVNEMFVLTPNVIYLLRIINRMCMY